MDIAQDLSVLKEFFILVVSLFSNLFSALSGGGAGLIQLPALLFLGIPYYQALALHKAATVALGVGGSIRNFSELRDDYRLIFQLLIIGIPGVIIGSSLVKTLPEDYLYFLLGVFSILIGSYSLSKPNFGLNSISKEITLFINIRFSILIFAIAILNGSISSGTGLLVTLLLIKTFGIDFLRSIRITFLAVGIFWNAFGALALIREGSIPINILFILLFGSLLGGFAGAHLSNLKGNTLIKKSFTIICFLIGLTLVIKSLGKIFI